MMIRLGGSSARRKLSLRASCSNGVCNVAASPSVVSRLPVTPFTSYSWGANCRFMTSSTSSSPASSSSSSAYDNNNTTHRHDLRFSYVHHVSKTVLLHLQESRADWVRQQGLDRGLRLNPNGTFVLHFPAKRGFDAGRIWTSYDGVTKQHWLSLYKGKLNCRFLLKDGSSSFYQNLSFMQKRKLGHKFPTVQEEIVMMENFIRQVVDQMIITLDDENGGNKRS